MKTPKIELRELVRELKKRTGLNQYELSKAAGYKPRTITQTLSRDAGHEEMLKHLRSFSETLSSSADQRSILSIDLKKDNQAIDRKDSDLSISAIHNLTIANREMAESNKKLAEGHVELIAMLKDAIATQPVETPVASRAIPTHLLELLAEIGSGKKLWRSKQEALAKLSIAFPAEVKDKKAENTHHG